MRTIFVLLISIFFGVITLQAQKTNQYKDPYAEFQRAQDLFTKKLYGPAFHSYEQVFDATLYDSEGILHTDASYYKALCAIELFHNDAAFLMTEFIENHQGNAKLGFAYFQLGKHLFYKRNYKEAQNWFEKVDARDLTEKELNEYYFKNGYSAFVNNDFQNARTNLFQIINSSSKYSGPANYYYAHIAYEEKDYNTALISLEKIENSPNFSMIVPYYKTHIYYKQKRYQDVIDYAPGLLSNANPKRAPEIAGIIGKAYFEQKKYKEAAAYLEKYMEHTPRKVTRDENYMLGISYYKTGNFEKSISYLEKTTALDDSMSQNAYYHIGDCCIKTQEKQFARNAFYFSYKLNFDKKITEDALFQYAKLSYELSIDPFTEAIRAFERLLVEFPNTEKKQQVYEYLVELYLNTKNFEAALKAIENSNLDDLKMQMVYQKITYFRGVELIIANQFKEAIALFERSIQYPYNDTILSMAFYWKAEAHYQIKEYDQAIRDNNRFLRLSGSVLLNVFNMAHYNIGYAYFQQKKYPEAANAFRKFVQKKENEPKKIIADAYNRIADSYFIEKQYSEAKNYYQQAYNLRIIDDDYALFQKSLALGALGSNPEKIKTLEKFLFDFPTSTYRDDALYELGNTYFTEKHKEKSLDAFKKLVLLYPESSYIKKTLLQTGLIHYNSGNNTEAIKTLKQVVEKYPGTAESREALSSLRNIYMEMDQVDEYFKYAEGVSFSNVTKSEQDSLLFLAAENHYLDGNCDKALSALSAYTARFSDGIFAIHANYYMGICYMKSEDFEKAVNCFSFVTSKPKNKFSESALLNIAELSFMLQQYEQAAVHFEKLSRIAEYPSNRNKALIGAANSFLHLDHYEKCITYAEKILTAEKPTEHQTIQAHLLIATCAFKQENFDLAEREYNMVKKISQGIEAAEAAFFAALIQHKKENFDAAENMVFELIKQYPSYQDWLARAFILLADNYEKKGNIFQAKHTLQSIIDNYSGDNEIKKEAKMKLFLLTEQETKDQNEPDTNEVVIPYEKIENENHEQFEEF